MEKNDFDQFAGIWRAACDIYGKTPGDMAIALTFRTLAKYDLVDIKRAISAHAMDTDSGRFMPKPADIIKHIDGDSQSRCLQAWTKVEDAIRKTGPYKSVTFDDSIVMACMDDMGGWISICEVTDDELPFKRNEFVNRYKGFLVKPPESFPSKLLGIAEAHNSSEGLEHKEEVILIGNPEKALLIHKSGKKRKLRAMTLSDAKKLVDGRSEGGLKKLF